MLGVGGGGGDGERRRRGETFLLFTNTVHGHLCRSSRVFTGKDLKNRNGLKRMFQTKETWGIINPQKKKSKCHHLSYFYNIFLLGPNFQTSSKFNQNTS